MDIGCRLPGIFLNTKNLQLDQILQAPPVAPTVEDGLNFKFLSAIDQYKGWRWSGASRKTVGDHGFNKDT